jgi:hypothetical protein
MTNDKGRVTCNALLLRIVKLVSPDFRILFNHKLGFTPHKILSASRFFLIPIQTSSESQICGTEINSSLRTKKGPLSYTKAWHCFFLHSRACYFGNSCSYSAIIPWFFHFLLALFFMLHVSSSFSLPFLHTIESDFSSDVCLHHSLPFLTLNVCILHIRLGLYSRRVSVKFIIHLWYSSSSRLSLPWAVYICIILII